MPQLNYLDLSDLRYSDCALDVPDRRLTQLPEGLESVSALQALAEGLALQPFSSKVCRLAERIYGALEAHQQHLYARPPAGFPLSQAEEVQCRGCTSAWRALGRAYARWCFAQQYPTEAGLLVGAIACLGQIVRLCGFYHRQIPEGLWLDLHVLFQLAHTAKLARTKRKWLGLRHRADTTPEWEYLRVVLLGLADPYGLLPQEVMLLDSLLEKWVMWVKIAKDSAEGWQLDFQQDVPAHWGASGPRLDLTALAELFAAHRHLAAPVGRFESWSQPPDTIPLGLLERLERDWFQPPVEPAGFPSMPAEWVIGLEEIFARLQGKATESIAVTIDAGQAEVAGVRPESVQVGDLVGVFVPDGGDLIGLAGVDRLLWSESAQVLHVQLKAMPGKVFAVGIQPFYRARQPCAYQRGLLLAEAKRLSLLLAEQPLQVGVVVRLLYGDKLYPVRLDECQNPARKTLSCRCVSAAGLVQK